MTKTGMRTQFQGRANLSILHNFYFTFCKNKSKRSIVEINLILSFFTFFNDFDSAFDVFYDTFFITGQVRVIWCRSGHHRIYSIG